VKSKQPRRFDPAQLEAMVEPLTVRVERQVGSSRTPIQLWKDEWEKSEISGLETNLVTEWSGGGLYSIIVMDSSQPPAKLEWEPYFPPNEFPIRTPPPLQSATQGASVPSNPPPSLPPTSAAAMAAPPQPSFIPQVRPMANQPFFNPYANLSVQPMQAPTWSPPGYTPPPAPAVNPAVSAASQAAAVADAERRRMEEELRAMREAFAKQREDMLAAQHRAEMERREREMKADQAAIDTRFARLESLIEKTLTAKPAGPDPALEALREQNRMLAEKAEAERREREAERRERAIEDRLARQAEESRRQFDALQAAMQANKGPDPMVMMMQEMTRQQIEAMKEQARAQQFAAERMSQNMLSPRDIIQITKDNSNDANNVLKNITAVYSDMFSTQRTLIEQAAQLNQSPGDTPIAVVREGIEKLTDLAGRYTASKSKETVASLQAQAAVEQTKIQAAMLAQNPHLAAAAQGEQQAQQQIAAPTVVAGQLPADAKPANVEPAPAAATGPKRMGRTDEQWFGPILSHVIQLRERVAVFLDAVTSQPMKIDPKTGRPPGFDPDDTAEAIGQALYAVQERQLAVPVMTDLLMQDRIAEFMDVLLPDVPQAYRDDVVQSMLSDGDEEGEEAEEAEEAPAVAPVAAPVVAAPAPGGRLKNGKSARA